MSATPHESSRFIASWMLCIGNLLVASGCVEDANPREDAIVFTEGHDESETAASSDESGAQPGTPEANVDSVSMEPDTANELACTQTNNCHMYCVCSSGTCVPDGFGPPPEGDLCNQPPQRECNSGADCQTGCVCSGGHCQDDGIGAVNPTCHLPPPDSYESDNTWQAWKAYGGVPQWHNLHTATDTDWIAVLMPVAGNVHFRTHGLTYGTDTKIEVYAYNGITKGSLLGSNDDIGGAWWVADSKSSKVQLPVVANSAFLVRVINKSSASFYTDGYEWPSYSLEIAYY
jgi:hypothetical protein